MGWVVSIALIFGYIFYTHDITMLIAAGLFAIAGAIGFKDFK